MNLENLKAYPDALKDCDSNLVFIFTIYEEPNPQFANHFVDLEAHANEKIFNVRGKENFLPRIELRKLHKFDFDSHFLGTPPVEVSAGAYIETHDMQADKLHTFLQNVLWLKTIRCTLIIHNTLREQLVVYNARLIEDKCNFKHFMSDTYSFNGTLYFETISSMGVDLRQQMSLFS